MGMRMEGGGDAPGPAGESKGCFTYITMLMGLALGLLAGWIVSSAINSVFDVGWGEWFLPVGAVAGLGAARTVYDRLKEWMEL